MTASIYDPMPHNLSYTLPLPSDPRIRPARQPCAPCHRESAPRPIVVAESAFAVHCHRGSRWRLSAIFLAGCRIRRGRLSGMTSGSAPPNSIADARPSSAPRPCGAVSSRKPLAPRCHRRQSALSSVAGVRAAQCHRESRCRPVVIGGRAPCRHRGSRSPRVVIAEAACGYPRS